jgi:hypothetical protein
MTISMAYLTVATYFVSIAIALLLLWKYDKLDFTVGRIAPFFDRTYRFDKKDAEVSKVVTSICESLSGSFYDTILVYEARIETLLRDNPRINMNVFKALCTAYRQSSDPNDIIYGKGILEDMKHLNPTERIVLAGLRICLINNLVDFSLPPFLTSDKLTDLDIAKLQEAVAEARKDIRYWKV